VSFCLQGWHGSLIFCFYRLKSISIKTKKQCAVCGSDKKHDGKNYRRVGVGEGQKRPCKLRGTRSGDFLTCGACRLVGLIAMDGSCSVRLSVHQGLPLHIFGLSKYWHDQPCTGLLLNSFLLSIGL